MICLNLLMICFDFCPLAGIHALVARVLAALGKI